MVAMFTPTNLAEALQIRREHPAIPLAGGTDLLVKKRSWSGTLPRFEQPVIYIGNVPEFKTIHVINDSILTIGAAVTLSEVLENQAIPEILKRAVAETASPAIRNAGTLGGNICNASPAADTLPPLYALGAAVLLANASGSRELPIFEFIKGPGLTVLKNDELLVAVNIPLVNYQVIHYQKVGTRKADGLSKVSFAGLAGIEGGTLQDLRIALGAVAPTVVRSREAENLLKGRKINELSGLVAEITEFYARLIRPIDDQRSSAAYRKMVSLCLIEYFIAFLGRTAGRSGRSSMFFHKKR
ncbi:MAG: FAD binding domain-containing protein [Bacillota bacterium]